MVRYELIQDDRESVLSSGITAAATSITVTDGSVFPSTGDFRVKIDSEVLLVTGRSTNTLTVVRGVDDSTAATHSGGATVRVIASRSQFEVFRNDITFARGYDTDNTWAPPPHRLLDNNGDVLTASSFTWVNQGTSTVADEGDGLVIRPQAGAGTNLRGLYITAPSTPWTCIILAFMGPGQVAGSSDFGGIMCRESSSSKIETFRFLPKVGKVTSRYTNATTFSSNFGTQQDLAYNWFWHRLDDDGTNLTWYHGVNGVNWKSHASQARGTFFTTGPDQVGFCCQANSTGAVNYPFHIASFTLT